MKNNRKMQSGLEQDDLFRSLKRFLQAFQSKRLSSTYEDLKQDTEYALIGDFFFNKLYAPEDFTFRDTSIKNIDYFIDTVLEREIAWHNEIWES